MIDPDEVKRARRRLGKLLATYREDAGWTQQRLATVVFYGRSTIANIEAGRQGGLRLFWERVDLALNAGGELVRGYDGLQLLEGQRRKEALTWEDDQKATESQHGDAWLAGQGSTTVDEVKRRSALAVPLLALASTVGEPSEPWSRLAHALAQPARLDNQAVEYLEWRTLEFFRREEYTPARQLAPELANHVDQLKHLLSGGAFRDRLLCALGEALALAGWLAWDSKKPSAAQGFYHDACDAARQVGDGPLYACTLAYHSYMAEAGGNLPLARSLLERAERHARGAQSAATRSWVAARVAEVSANLNDDGTALRALERAITVYDYARPHSERVWTSFFTPSRLGSMAVSTYAQLDHEELDATTTSVVTSMPKSDAKVKAVILADVATAVIQRGQHERGAELAHQALDQTLAHEASLGRQRLHGLRQMIRTKHQAPVIAELDDRLAAHAL